MKPLALIFTLAATVAHATPWDIPDGHGGWKANPDCTGSCAEYRDSQRKELEGPKAKPQPEILDKPVDWPPGKPTPTAKPKDDRDAPPDRQTPGYYCILDGEVVNYRHASGPVPQRVTRACPWYAHKVRKEGGE